jgi:hypothetical protein
MARYNSSLYDTFLYGQGFVVGLTVDPFEALAVDYDRVVVQYTQPSGEINRFRIVRSQEGIPESPEDGVLVVDEAYTEDPFAESKTIFDADGLTPGNFIPFTPGKYVYYAAWALLDDGWFLCGTTSTVIVERHREILEDGTALSDSHKKLLSILPRLYTSDDFNPLDEINYNSDLAQFLFGFSYSLDELLTYIDLLIPDYTQRNLSPSRLEFKSRELGLSLENRPSTKQQKRLVRDAIQLYSQKGTPEALRKYVQDLTGFTTEVTTSANLLLSPQDSTFFKSVGNWKTYGNCAITSVRNVAPPVEADAVDTLYTGRVVVGDEYARIGNGTAKPLLYGVPVSGGEEYTFSFYYSYLNQTTGVSVKANIQWFDYRGNKISQNAQATFSAATSAWQQTSLTASAPAGATRAGIEILFQGTGTVYIDMVQLALGTTTDYSEPRQAIITLFPTKKNLITNPSFENFTELSSEFPGWSITADTVTQEDYDETTTPPLGVLNAGAHYAQIVTTDGGTTEVELVIEPREFECFWYTFSFYAKSADDAIPLTASITIEDTNPEATLSSATQTISVLVTDEWQRFEVSGCVSGRYIDERLTVKIFGETIGQTLLLDMAQIEPTFSKSDYFDGTHTSLGGEWEGTAHESESYLYENIPFKMTRLDNEIENFLPTNTPYVVKTLTDVVFSGVS